MFPPVVPNESRNNPHCRYSLPDRQHDDSANGCAGDVWRLCGQGLRANAEVSGLWLL
ncbi:hypothetical protein RBSH_05379 [Rhodopirellula baltica SH28]|uniref:Uncharacterized protein n=1 Tax=Rhodopirellula baltica SH28 TaxID=993517 RepID=K5E0R9_RHOBT|nr:hypothetical protein RBSH_05379 [Rhodopirellula baltica SH28]